jgi:SAM-dependent methyltransferase
LDTPYQATIGWSDAASFLNYTRTIAPVLRKADFITKHCRGRNVLDVGCVDHTADAASTSDWLHATIGSVARSSLGVDTAESEVAALAARGYAVEVGDAERLQLNRKFDVVVAGDVIEHLSNIGQFLESAKRHLVPGGVLVITTPNTFSIDQFARALAANYVSVNPEHTVSLDPAVTWELARRFGFTPVDFAWLETRFRIIDSAKTAKERLVAHACEWIARRRPILRQDFGVALRA